MRWNHELEASITVSVNHGNAFYKEKSKGSSGEELFVPRGASTGIVSPTTDSRVDQPRHDTPIVAPKVVNNVGRIDANLAVGDMLRDGNFCPSRQVQSQPAFDLDSPVP